MEQSGIKEILRALELHSRQIDKKMQSRFEETDKKIDGLEKHMNDRFDRLEKKFDGMQVELRETQETVDFLHSK
ncbi:hypothetical protein [Virgibacillus necropolis]|uniref:hypothetical protein n=1 Tax=Virgibacillus necropolis TaxID=163877 RepID=UPI001D059F2A|nr:hypothetical protein [Virgibacillus necropolis]